MRVLVAMSGGVDSSVAAALLRDEGHEVVGATLKLWGGASDSGCCSIQDTADARRVADHLGIEHFVFNLTEAFEDHVVGPYVAEHAKGRTPNPCVECNRHIKFGAFFAKALRLGYDAVATGHHARIVDSADGPMLARGADSAKDQSYVLSVLSGHELDRLLLPVGEMQKAEVRALATALGLRTATKPDSQDVCFITSRTKDHARADFLRERIALHPGRILEQGSGRDLGHVDAVELMTVGQRRGLHSPSGERRYVVAVDVRSKTVTVGEEKTLLERHIALLSRTWVRDPLRVGTPVFVQTSAHGEVATATISADGVILDAPRRKVAPGQVVAYYLDDVVVGSGVVA